MKNVKKENRDKYLLAMGVLAGLLGGLIGNLVVSSFYKAGATQSISDWSIFSIGLVVLAGVVIFLTKKIKNLEE